MRSLYGRARRRCCAQYAHRLNADVHCVRLTYIGQGRLWFEIDFRSGSLPTSSYSLDGAVHLATNYVFYLFSTAFDHTDGSVIMEQGGAAKRDAAYRGQIVVCRRAK